MGLFVHGGMAAMLGAGKKDVSMLMSYVATDKLLRVGGRLAFVITQTVFKTAGAGQGFRRFQVGELGGPVGVEHVDDMVDLSPFVGAANRTAMFTWKKGARTRYPVTYTLWQRTRRAAISADSPLDLVREVTRTLPLAAAPVSGADSTSAWLSTALELVEPLRRLGESGTPAYEAHAGVYSGLNGVYWVSREGPPDAQGRIPITNLHDVGRTQLPLRHGRVEEALLHPLIRGADVRRWSVAPSAHILFVQDPVRRQGIAERVMLDQYPGGLEYLAQFEDVLGRRRGLRAVLRRNDAPFWSMLGVGEYSMAEHKVVWKDQAADFTAAVVSGGDPVPLPNHKVILIACRNEEEAHYLCGTLNSTPVRLFVASYAVETQISTHTVKYIHIPCMDEANEIHVAVASASRAAHAAVSDGRDPPEDAVDRAAAALWGLDERDVAAMRSFLDKLRKRDLTIA